MDLKDIATELPAGQDVEVWSEYFGQRRQRTAEQILHNARALFVCRERLGANFKKLRRRLKKQFGGESAISKLLMIGAAEHIFPDVHLFPASESTIYEISRIPPGERYSAAKSRRTGCIHPNAIRDDVLKWKGDKVAAPRAAAGDRPGKLLMAPGGIVRILITDDKIDKAELFSKIARGNGLTLEQTVDSPTWLTFRPLTLESEDEGLDGE